MANGLTIEIYLMDGTSFGRREVRLSNWNCVTYQSSRSDIKKCSDLLGIHAAGVYFLLGKENNKCFVYVGEGDDVLKRIGQPHQFEKDNKNCRWTDAIILVTPDGTLDKAKIKFLEYQFHQMIIESGIYISKNGTIPQLPGINKKKRDELEAFIQNAVLVIPTLGYNFLNIPPVDSNTGIPHPPLMSIPANVSDFIKKFECEMKNDVNSYFDYFQKKGISAQIIAKVALKYAIDNNLIGKRELEMLCDKSTARLFKGGGWPILKLTKGDENDYKDSSGRNRYCKMPPIERNGKKYLISTQLYNKKKKDSITPLVVFLVNRGVKLQKIVELCSQSLA